MMADLRMTAAMMWAINVMCLGVLVFDLKLCLIQMLGWCCAGCDALDVHSLKHHVSWPNHTVRMDFCTKTPDVQMDGMVMASMCLIVSQLAERLLWQLNVLIK